MLVRLIQVIHWFIYLIFIFLISIIIWDFIEYQHFRIINNLLSFDTSDPFHFFSTTFCLTLIIPFIRYIIFGRIGWFPWTPFRKEEGIKEKRDNNSIILLFGSIMLIICIMLSFILKREFLDEKVNKSKGYSKLNEYFSVCDVDPIPAEHLELCLDLKESIK